VKRLSFSIQFTTLALDFTSNSETLERIFIDKRRMQAQN
jgi:hypothetical protein